MADLSTKFMGLTLPTPIVLGSSALSNRLENLQAAEGHGAGAVVLRSLFEEQIEAADSSLQEELSRGSENEPGAHPERIEQRIAIPPAPFDRIRRRAQRIEVQCHLPLPLMLTLFDVT